MKTSPSLRNHLSPGLLPALLGLFICLITPDLPARTWTSADGSKTFEGELKSYDESSGKVGVTMASGKSLTFK